jgi:hypothetical protein
VLNGHRLPRQICAIFICGLLATKIVEKLPQRTSVNFVGSAINTPPHLQTGWFSALRGLISVGPSEFSLTSVGGDLSTD